MSDTHDVIRAKRFVLVDDDGGMRGEWKMSPKGPSFYMYENAGDEKPLVALALRGDRSVLFSLDLDGANCVSVDTCTERGAEISLWRHSKVVARIPLPDSRDGDQG